MRLLAQAIVELDAVGNRNSGCNPTSAKKAGNKCGRPKGSGKKIAKVVPKPKIDYYSDESEAFTKKALKKRKLTPEKVASWFEIKHDKYRTGKVLVNVDAMPDYNRASTKTLAPAKNFFMEVTGEIVNKQGRVVGEFEREIDFKNKHAHFQEFHVQPAHQKKGIASSLLATQISNLRKNGIKTVSLNAGDKGAYAWAIAGFDSPFVSDFHFEMKEYLDIDEDYYDDMTAKERAKKKKIGARIDKLKSMHDIARFKIGGKKVGKEILLNSNFSWEGHMDIGNPNSKGMKALKILLRRKGIKL